MLYYANSTIKRYTKLISDYNTSAIQTLAELSIDGQSFIHPAYSFAFLLYATFNPLLLFSPPNIHILDTHWGMQSTNVFIFSTITAYESLNSISIDIHEASVESSCL